MSLPIAAIIHIFRIFIVVFLTEFTSPYSLNTQRGRHTSKKALQYLEEMCVWSISGVGFLYYLR